ncbi:MAG: DsbA family protein [Spirochaetes bacterium]|nr:DsbA family protein [Spirochaetota bacterium]
MNEKKLNFRDILQIIQTLILIVLVVEVTMMFRDSKKAQIMPERRQQEPKKININLDELTGDAYFMGKKDAKATLVLFNSFSCGYCARVREPLMKLAEKFPDDLRIVYKHFNRGDMDELPAQAVECAGEQGKFWEMYNRIFDKGVRVDPKAYAKELGLNSGKFNDCVSTGRYKSKAEKDTNDGAVLGVRGTPSFILNDKLIPGYRPYPVFEKMVEDELKK